MKRDIIIIEDKAVSVTGNDVWMTAGEIAGLFHTGVPAVNAAIKAILKTDVLSDYEVCRYIQLENGLYADVYSLSTEIFSFPAIILTIFIASASTFKMNLGSSRIAFIQLFR